MQLVFSVAEFVAQLNFVLGQTLPVAVVEGELSELRISKGRSAYFKLKDDTATVNCFAGISALPGPLEDGMLVKAVGTPKHHLQYGFSFNVQAVSVSGEGNIKKAQELLKAKLEKEGLFDAARKRTLPEIPEKVGLITSIGSAAEADFLKISSQRWGGLKIVQQNVLVQGVDAPGDVSSAVAAFNNQSELVEVLVIVRGGGSIDDLAAFSDERVVRAVAASRIPTLVAIGHEIDLSLAELAADVRASTPSNAAQILVPDRKQVITTLRDKHDTTHQKIQREIAEELTLMKQVRVDLADRLHRACDQLKSELQLARQVIVAHNPTRILQQGYSLVRKNGQVVPRVQKLKQGDSVQIEFADGTTDASITSMSNESSA